MKTNNQEGSMKPATLIVIATVIMILVAPGASAQESGLRPQLYFVEEIVVKPGEIETYEIALKGMIDDITGSRIPMTFVGYLADDFRYYFLFPVENFGSVDKLYKSFGELAGKMGKKWEALHKKLTGVIEFEKFFMLRMRPDLSYLPAKPRLAESEMAFHEVAFIYVQYGKQAAFEKACKETQKILRKNNIPDTMVVYSGDLGTDFPMYLLVKSGKDPDDLAERLRVVSKALSKTKLKDVAKAGRSTFRKVEIKKVWSRPDLSMLPK
jgi:hypothetical protein